jgi:hypothetical protein
MANKGHRHDGRAHPLRRQLVQCLRGRAAGGGGPHPLHGHDAVPRCDARHPTGGRHAATLVVTSFSPPPPLFVFYGKPQMQSRCGRRGGGGGLTLRPVARRARRRHPRALDRRRQPHPAAGVFLPSAWRLIPPRSLCSRHAILIAVGVPRLRGGALADPALRRVRGGGCGRGQAARQVAIGEGPAFLRAALEWPGACLSLSDNPNPTALNDSCNRMYL